MNCPECENSGVVSERCPSCHGNHELKSDCNVCKGTGLHPTKKECHDCGATFETESE